MRSETCPDVHCRCHDCLSNRCQLAYLIRNPVIGCDPHGRKSGDRVDPEDQIRVSPGLNQRMTSWQERNVKLVPDRSRVHYYCLYLCIVVLGYIAIIAEAG